MKHYWAIFLICTYYLLTPNYAYSQNDESERIASLANLLDSLSISIPALNDSSDISIQQVPLHDFVRVIGKTHKINVYIDTDMEKLVSNTFTAEPVKNIFSIPQ